MSQTLSAVTPKLLAMGLMALRGIAVMPQIVNRGYDTVAGQKGSTIDVPIPSAIAAQAVSPGPTPPSTADVGPTSVSIPLDQWYEAPFYLTDKELLEVDRGIIPMQASEAIKTLADQINGFILGFYKKFYGFGGSAGVTPFAADLTAASQVRKQLQKQRAPLSPRHMVIDPDAEANVINTPQFQNVQWSGDPAGIIQAKLNERIGFMWWPHLLVKTHTAGTAAAATVTLVSNSALAATSVTLKVSTSTATLVEGDIFTIAGDPQTYVVTLAAGYTLDATGVVVAIAPTLQKAVDGSGTAVAVTVKASHVANLAMHRDAIAFATRPFENVEPGLGSITSSAVDEESGLSLRLEITREFKRTRYSYDVLYGAQVIRRELGARLAG